jgi:hypothetical protein
MNIYINTLYERNVEFLKVKLAVHTINTGLYSVEMIINTWTSLAHKMSLVL